MRRLTTLFALAALLGFGMFTVVSGSAVARPAEHYSYADCDEYTFDDTTYTYCYQTEGLLQINQTPSGNFMYHDKGTTCYQYYVNGELVEEGCSRYNYHELAKDFSTQVSHYNTSFEYTSGGVTCSGTFAYHYANGETRHDFSDFQCS